MMVTPPPEAAKHRRAVAQVLTLLGIAVIWSVAGVLVLQRLGVPVSSLVASAAVIGAALGFGAQQVVRDLLAGLFIVVERQYGSGDLAHISALGFERATGTIEEVALRTTRLRTLTGEPCSPCTSRSGPRPLAARGHNQPPR